MTITRTYAHIHVDGYVVVDVAVDGFIRRGAKKWLEKPHLTIRYHVNVHDNVHQSLVFGMFYVLMQSFATVAVAVDVDGMTRKASIAQRVRVPTC